MEHQACHRIFSIKKSMVYTLGESLVDVIITDNHTAVLKAGGGMLNTAVSLGRSGIEVSLISELGDDKTAEFVLDFLATNNVNTSCIKKYYHQNTSVALAFLDENKKPDYSIHKSYPEKRRIISPKKFTSEDILIFGSLYSLDPDIRNDLVSILAEARKAGTFIIYDPNIRKHKIEGTELTNALRENMAFADIIKGSDEDMVNIFGKNDPQFYKKEIQKINPKAIFILTMGEGGAIGFLNGDQIHIPAIQTEVLSTIGAGDAFNAGMAYYLQSNTEEGSLPGKSIDLKELIKAGTKFSANVCSSMENYVSKGFEV